MYKSTQLANTLRQMIEDGTWLAHQKLPSLREQAQQTGYSLMTVLNAYQELEAQGLIYSKEKSGFFVAQSVHIPEQQGKNYINSKIEINSFVFRYLKSVTQPDMVAFGSAFPDNQWLYHKKLMQLLAQYAKQPQRYAQQDNMPPGNLALRKVLANRYRLQGMATEADDIVITSGALDALNLSLQALTQAGDYILLQQTAFYGAWQAAQRLGLQVITIPEHPQYGFDLEAFEQALQQYPIKVCWLMLNHHNPIGFTVNDEIKQRIADLLLQYRVYLIEDDVYQELHYGQHKNLPMKFFCPSQVLHCSSFSKVLALGTRIGWVHAGQFSQAVQHLQLMSTVSASPLLQAVLADFLTQHHLEKHLRTLRSRLENLKKQYYQYLKQHLPADCEVYYYSGGYFLWIKLPTQLTGMQVYDYLLPYRISIAPSELFRMAHLPQHFIRLNCSLPWHDGIIQALQQLCDGIAWLASQHPIQQRTD